MAAAPVSGCGEYLGERCRGDFSLGDSVLAPMAGETEESEAGVLGARLLDDTDIGCVGVMERVDAAMGGKISSLNGFLATRGPRTDYCMGGKTEKSIGAYRCAFLRTTTRYTGGRLEYRLATWSCSLGWDISWVRWRVVGSAAMPTRSPRDSAQLPAVYTTPIR